MRLSKAEGKRMMQKLGMTEAQIEFAEEAGEEKSKYGNRKTEVDGTTFHSAAEARRYQELRLLEEAGEIHTLQLQVRLPLYAVRILSLVPGEELREVAHYVADFTYYRKGENPKQGYPIVEDVKGAVTQVYALKKRWFEAQTGIKIVEIRYGRRR